MHSLSHCTFTSFCFPLLSCSLYVMFWGEVSSLWLVFFLFFLLFFPSHLPNVSLGFIDCTHILLAPFSFPLLSFFLFTLTLPCSHLLFNQIGARPVELSTPPPPPPSLSLSFLTQLYAATRVASCYCLCPSVDALGPKICSVKACYCLDTNTPGQG